ncbi:MAG: TlpA family protein disulfide reductase [Anaerolineae bacterium]|nr:TlpA family protein disulfide reductase [Anaerolineae bacterium]
MAPLVASDRLAPSFRLSGLDGQTYTQGNGESGQWRLLIFFHTGCPTTPLVLPYLQRLSDAYTGPGFALWGISQDPAEPTAAYVQSLAVRFPMLLDRNNTASRAYGIHTVPTLILVDGGGLVRWVGMGLNKESLNTVALEIGLRLRRDPVVVAPPDDGVPVFRPG